MSSGKASEDEDGMFADLAEEMQVQEAGLPEYLEEYDTTAAAPGVAAREAKMVFRHWLRAELSGRSVVHPAPVTEIACRENPDLFFPEDYPSMWDYVSTDDLEAALAEAYPDGYTNGQRVNVAQGIADLNPTYLAAYYGVHTQATMAKKECSSCPIREACLAAAVVHEKHPTRELRFPDMPRVPGENDLEDYTEFRFGVSGGWGPASREMIANEFVKLVRNYKAATREVDPDEDRMPLAVREQFISEAEALDLSGLVPDPV